MCVCGGVCEGEGEMRIHESKALNYGYNYVTELSLDEGSNPVLARVDDDFWDYDRQVDLEAFSTKQLFGDLSNQSQRVISTIDSQNEQVCIHVHRISRLANDDNY